MPKCKHEGCPIRATYGTEKYKPIFCKAHKDDTMVDVKNAKCIQFFIILLKNCSRINRASTIYSIKIL